MAYDEQTFKDIDVNDTIGLHQLVGEGKLVVLEPGTQVQLLALGTASWEDQVIRFRTGPYAGQKGYVAFYGLK